MPPDLPSSEALPVGPEMIEFVARQRERLEALPNGFAPVAVHASWLAVVDAYAAALDLARRELGESIALRERGHLLYVSMRAKRDAAESKLAAAELVVEAARKIQRGERAFIELAGALKAYAATPPTQEPRDAEKEAT